MSSISDSDVECLLTTEELMEPSDPEWMEKVKEVVENLSVKDQITRKESFAALLTTMRKHYCAQVLAHQADTVRERCEWAILKGSAEEKELGSNLLQVLLLTFPDIEVRDRVIKTLGMVTADEEDNESFRRIALRIVHFFKFTQLEEDLHSDFDSLQELFEDPAVSTTAVNMYALLLTLQNDEDKSDKLDSIGNQLLPILEMENDADFNIASGKLICQLTQAYFDADRSDCDYIIYKLTEIMEDLSAYTSKASLSKKEAKHQRRMFRDFLDTMESQTIPSMVLVVNDHELTLEGWDSIVRYEHLRSVLKGGILEHATENEVVRGMLNIVRDVHRPGLTKAQKQLRAKKEKRVYGSPDVGM